MRTYQVSEQEWAAMRRKIVAAQTLLNVNCVALAGGGSPVSMAVRLDMAEEAEDLVHDVADILDRVRLRGTRRMLKLAQ